MPVWLLEGGEDAVLYTTVYLIERSLSLDNLFVFLLLFSYFGVPYERRPRLLYWGIVAALVMRGVFILAGSELIEQFHVVIYLLGAALIVLAYRIWRGVSENVDPDKNLMVRAVRRVYPVTSEFHEGHWFVKQDGRRHATPIFLCLAAIVFADIAFAIDSIPAAFAITRDPLLIWMGNVFALLGMRALFVLVESLVERFRYLDETIAIVLGLVGVKLLIEESGEDRASGQPRDDRAWPSRSASCSRSAPTGAIRTLNGTAASDRSDARRRRGRASRSAQEGRPLVQIVHKIGWRYGVKLTYLGPMERRATDGWLQWSLCSRLGHSLRSRARRPCR